MSSSAQYNDGTLKGGLMIKRGASAYSPRQITKWLSSIEFPHPVSDDDIAHGRFPTTLENLTLINRLFLVAVPYENTTMHYSVDHSMDISTEGLYQRIAVERQGSYCFGLNIFFFQMLCGLGYRAYTGSGRVNLSKEARDIPVYTALSHMIILVQPGEESNITYLVDVGCGGSGPARPILLSSSEDNIVMGITPTEQHRLTRGARSDSRLVSATTEWHLNVLHIKGGPDAPPAHWRVVYAFSEEEFFPTDFESANFAVYCKPGGFFWDKIVASRHFWLDEKEARVTHSMTDRPIETRHVGRFGMEGAVIRRHIGSHTDIVRTVTTEAERAEALRKFFGIHITAEALEYIRGRASALCGWPLISRRLDSYFASFRV